jgi:hypothetical protein
VLILHVRENCFCNLSRRFARRFGERHREVAGEVAVSSVAGNFDVNRGDALQLKRPPVTSSDESVGEKLSQ